MGSIALLTGTYPRTLDEKLRLALPKPLRDALGDQLEQPFFVTPGTDGSLAVYPERAFDRLAARLSEMSPGAAPSRDYRRLFYAQATRAELDKTYRFRIPQPLAEQKQLEKEVVLLGLHDHMEIWSQDRWQSYLSDRSERYDQIAEAAFSQKNSATGPAVDFHSEAPPPRLPTRPR